ncbi:MAG: hypothetical protein J5945_03710 [Candidatus Methanomethylophilus sp.]|nr:hypothetical protein [Methanomethylophilus sp.]
MENRSISGRNYPDESDWILFRERRKEWIERYYTRILTECAGNLYGPGTPSERFWKLEEHVRKEKRILDRLGDFRRSTMSRVIADMLELEIITFGDLEDFSEEFIRCEEDILDARRSSDE